MTETRRRVLVIEDDPETASQLVDFLRTRGYEVDLARNGHDGLRLLTRISQIETTTQTSGFRPVDLVEIGKSVADLCDAAAEEKKVDLQVIGQKPMLITGDPDLLFDAVANLVDNAIKHGREAGRVVVRLDRHDDGTVISVADNGPGVPVDERQHVFRRFYRLEGSRRTLGNGLGLSLVAAVARCHNARIELLDNAPGLKVEMWLRSD